MQGNGRIEVGTVSTGAEVERLLPLMRAYCDFYRVQPPDAALLAMSRSLIADPTREGVQLIATDGDQDLGFATLFWSWETTSAGRVGVMNDLYVVAASRGRGVGSALIRACLERCRDHGAVRMVWPDGGRQSGRTGRLRPRRRHSRNLGRLLARHRRVQDRGDRARAEIGPARSASSRSGTTVG